MQLIYLDNVQLQDRLMMRDLFKHFPKLKPPFILLHESYPETVDGIRMLTKRISSHLSESMVPNLAFSGDQRGFITRTNDEFPVIKTDLLVSHFKTVHGIVLNSLSVDTSGANTELLPARTVLKAFRRQLDLERIIFFPDRASSPLGGNQTPVTDEKDYETALAAFEEEQAILDLALYVKPSVIASPLNFWEN